MLPRVGTTAVPSFAPTVAPVWGTFAPKARVSHTGATLLLHGPYQGVVNETLDARP